MPREEGGSKEDIFKKSIRTLRSSPRGDDREEEMVGMFKEWKEEIKREMRERMRGLKEELRKIAEEQKEDLKREMEGVREELAVMDERWRREREEMRVRMEKMERELEGLKGKAGRGKEDNEERAEREETRGKNEEWRIRIKALERKWERKERDDRRKNILIKGLKVGEEELKKRVEKILEGVRGDIKVEEVKNIQAGKMEKGKLVVVRLKSEDMRRRVLRNKGKGGNMDTGGPDMGGEKKEMEDQEDSKRGGGEG